MRFLLRLYPKDFRRRHGVELLDHLKVSSTPLRDGFDVVKSALAMRMEEVMPKRSLLIWGAVLIGGVSVVLFGLALDGLAAGISEVPRHWWSTLPVVGLVIAGAMAVIATRVPVGSDKDE